MMSRLAGVGLCPFQDCDRQPFAQTVAGTTFGGDHALCQTAIVADLAIDLGLTFNGADFSHLRIFAGLAEIAITRIKTGSIGNNRRGCRRAVNTTTGRRGILRQTLRGDQAAQDG